MQDVIKHIMSLYKRNKQLCQEWPLKFTNQKDWEAYDLWIIDDDEDYYVPYYDMAPLDPNDYLEEFPSLAFCESKSYNPVESP